MEGPECMPKYNAVMANCISNSTHQCNQFCSDFPHYIPYIFASFSTLSGLCCLGVFATYFCLPRLRKTGNSSKVFLYRTLMDFIIALGHMVAGPSKLVVDNGIPCKMLGVVNEFALVASNLWYIFLAIDLIQAIRNPFNSHPRYGWLSHLIVWLFSTLCAVALALLSINLTGPGRSMFYWCWIAVDQTMSENVDDLITFSVVTLFLYYLLHFVFWVFSLIVVLVGGCILWSHLVASSETRKFVIKQNLVYVLILAIETIIIIPLWVFQLIMLRVMIPVEQKIQYYTHIDFRLAVVFAVVHSLRGTVDLIVWLWNFSIGPADVTDCFKRYKIKFSVKKELQVPSHSLSPSSIHLRTPLLVANKTDNLVNKALRRDAIYCINVGILESIQMHHDWSARSLRVGSVREAFSAAALMELDKENQRNELALLYTNPNYREQFTKKIRFPSSSRHHKYFTFIDLEPTIFSLLRESNGITPSTYRQSFTKTTLADIDCSSMLEKFAEGKSGSFFYFTHDYRFIIKTISTSEERFLRKIAHSYYKHMQENEDSLIVRFFGLHKVRLAPEQRCITVVVMENVFYNTDKLEMHRKFDLKGSWVGRRSIKSNQMVNRYKGTLKDLDLGEEKILIGSELKEQLMEQLRKDVHFLTSLHIMDYSLLLGIHQHNSFGITGTPISEFDFDGFTDVDTSGFPRCKDNPSCCTRSNCRTYSNRNGTVTSVFGTDDRGYHIPWFRQDCGGLQSDSQFHSYSSGNVSTALESERDSVVNVDTPPVTYFLGMVDILQQYNLRKRLEHVWKTRFMRQDVHGLSAVNEKEYGERFLNFLDGIIQ